MNKAARRLLGLALAAAALAACSGPSAVVIVSPHYDPSRIRRVALATFADYPGVPGSGEIAASTLEKYLLWGGYSVVERRQVDEILREQSLSASGGMDQATIRSLGKILGVDALAFGTLTDYSNAREQTVMVDQPQEQSDPIYGKIVTVQRNGETRTRTEQDVVTGYNTTSTDKVVPETESFPATVGMSLRLVDVESGELLWSASASADGVGLSAATEQASAELMRGVVKQLKESAKSSSNK